MTIEPAPTKPAHPPKPKKRGWGARLARHVGWFLLPGLVVGAVTWHLLRDATTEDKARQGALAAAILVLFAWQALRLRLARAGRSAAHKTKAWVLALLFLGAAGALLWWFWLRG